MSFELDLRMQRAAFGFPSVEEADENGLLAVGGDLHPLRLLVAYSNGIFPWPHRGFPEMLWLSTSPRPVLIPGSIHIGRSVSRSARKGRLEISFDMAFTEVIHSCATVARNDGAGTWITDKMIRAYTQLHELGFAHSVEAWRHGNLVGGLYGVSLGAAFFGESMFRTESGASRVTLIALMQRLRGWNFKFLDCQTRSPIANALGATDWDASTFQSALQEALMTPTRRTGWKRTPELFQLEPGDALS